MVALISINYSMRVGPITALGMLIVALGWVQARTQAADGRVYAAPKGLKRPLLSLNQRVWGHMRQCRKAISAQLEQALLPLVLLDDLLKDLLQQKNDIDYEVMASDMQKRLPSKALAYIVTLASEALDPHTSTPHTADEWIGEVLADLTFKATLSGEYLQASLERIEEMVYKALDHKHALLRVTYSGLYILADLVTDTLDVLDAHNHRQQHKRPARR